MSSGAVLGALGAAAVFIVSGYVGGWGLGTVIFWWRGWISRKIWSPVLRGVPLPKAHDLRWTWTVRANRLVLTLGDFVILNSVVWFKHHRLGRWRWYARAVRAHLLIAPPTRSAIASLAERAIENADGKVSDRIGDPRIIPAPLVKTS